MRELQVVVSKRLFIRYNGGKERPLGSQVKDQDMAKTIFKDLGNSPATFAASRWADFLGCVEGWEVQVADAIQAYIQAYIEGPALWVELRWKLEQISKTMCHVSEW